MRSASGLHNRLLVLVPLLGLLGGCSPKPRPLESEHAVTTGIVYREFIRGSKLSMTSDVYVLDLDLKTPGIRLSVVTDGPSVKGSKVFTDSHTVAQWCGRKGALCGINGGFFGMTEGSRKEVIGLLATGATIHSSGRVVHSRGKKPRRFVRSVFGVDTKGTPGIAWAVGERGRAGLLTTFTVPEDPTTRAYWNVDSAAACGPRLVKSGNLYVADHEERLVSSPALRRTFIGFSMEGGQPRFLTLCVARSMTYRDAAGFLDRYFRKYHKTACSDGMCLDGGGSSQLVYRGPKGYVSVIPAGTTVPTCVLVMIEPVMMEPAATAAP